MPLDPHISCLELAAADESERPEVRSRVAAMVHLARTAVITADLKEADRGN